MDLAEKLISLGFTNFQVTIDGPPSFHNYLRPLKNGKPTFDRIFKNVTALLDLSETQTVTIRTNFNWENIGAVNKLYEMFPKEYRRRIRILLEPIFRAKNLNANYKMSSEEIVFALTEIYNKAREMGFKVPDGIPKAGKLTYCFAERRSQVVINYNGDVFKCPTCNFMPEERVGYINEQGTLVFEKDKLSNWVFTGDFPEYCKECKYLPLCMGGCRLKYLTEKDAKSSCALIPTNSSFILKQVAYKNFISLINKECNKKRC